MGKKAEKFGFMSGLIVFFLGIGLLCFIFFLAYSVFVNPSGLARFGKLIPIGEGKFAEVAKALSHLIAIGLLWIMGSVAGKIAINGIRMFRSKPESA